MSARRVEIGGFGPRAGGIGLAWVIGVIGLMSFAAALIGQTSRSVRDGVYSDEQAKRGAGLYAKECASCHGSELSGGEEAPPLAGPEFLSNWNGLTVGDLFDRMRKSMPANDPGKLSGQQNADILAFMLAVNKFPAGKVELEKQSEALKQIRIEAK